MKTKILGLLAVGLLAGPTAANAALFQFDVSGTFEDGGTLVGQVSIDDSGCYNSPGYASSGNLTTSGGAFPSVTYSGLAFTWCNPFEGWVERLEWNQGDAVLMLIFPRIYWADLPNLTSVSLTSSLEAPPSGDGLVRHLTSGTMTRHTPVPEPGTLALLGLGLAGLGLSRRRKTN